MGDAMHLAGSASSNVVPARKSLYGLTEGEKMLSAIARWGTYANMKVRQAAFKDPLFVAMLQAARGPPETKGIVPTLTRQAFKGFMHAEFQVTGFMHAELHTR